MTETEGVIQFTCSLSRPGGALPGEVARLLLAWRSVLRRLDLIGRMPGRYGGLGYGNISRRVPGEAESFIITASQTGGIADADESELVRIRRFDLRRFRVEAEGTLPPSSETMTHAVIYTADPEVNWVFHGHCRAIWENARAAGLPMIGADVGYGTLRMAKAVAALLGRERVRPLVFVTLGHEDGVFACGASAADAGGRLLGVLARCLVLADRSGASGALVEGAGVSPGATSGARAG